MITHVEAAVDARRRWDGDAPSPISRQRGVEDVLPVARALHPERDAARLASIAGDDQSRFSPTDQRACPCGRRSAGPASQKEEPSRESWAKKPSGPSRASARLPRRRGGTTSRSGDEPVARRIAFSSASTARSSGLAERVGPGGRGSRAAGAGAERGGGREDRGNRRSPGSSGRPHHRTSGAGARSRSLDRGTQAQLGRSAARPGVARPPAVLEPVDEDHLDRAGDRDRRQRSDHAGELGADQHRDQHGQRRELHRPAVDDRLEHVVLELLVEDEEDQEHDPGRSSSRGSRRS